MEGMLRLPSGGDSGERRGAVERFAMSGGEDDLQSTLKMFFNNTDALEQLSELPIDMVLPLARAMMVSDMFSGGKVKGKNLDNWVRHLLSLMVSKDRQGRMDFIDVVETYKLGERNTGI
jgi:hypothetical protein